jgi:hypothetical protein
MEGIKDGLRAMSGQLILYAAIPGLLIAGSYIARPSEAELARQAAQQELWPKLGDGGVRKAAYRGG